jgi:hypothetical protein
LKPVLGGPEESQLVHKISDLNSDINSRSYYQTLTWVSSVGTTGFFEDLKQHARMSRPLLSLKCCMAVKHPAQSCISDNSDSILISLMKLGSVPEIQELR